jgi:hypothetical protein
MSIARSEGLPLDITAPQPAKYITTLLNTRKLYGCDVIIGALPSRVGVVGGQRVRAHLADVEAARCRSGLGCGQDFLTLTATPVAQSTRSSSSAPTTPSRSHPQLP